MNHQASGFLGVVLILGAAALLVAIFTGVWP